MTNADSSSGYNLAHPVYLDVPMMLSFLAHLEGGVTLSESETTRETGALARILKVRGGLKASLWSFGEFGGDAEKGREERGESTRESVSERHHTAASLFNALYTYLVDDLQIVRLQDPEQLEDLTSGQLVEVDAEYLGNPIEDVLAFFNSFMPYVVGSPDGDVAPEPESRNKQKRSGNPAKRAAANRPAEAPQKDSDWDSDGIRLMSLMSSDIASAPVHDLLFRTPAGLSAVVTVDSEYYSQTTHEYLRAGEFRVVGKVTRVLHGDQTINLTRRTVLGAAGSQMANELLGSISSEGLALDVAQPIVEAPAVQVLPMAIFI